MHISEIINAVESIAPTDKAQDWDNVGLLYGDPDNETNTVIICLDITDEVYKLAVEINAGLCISHHPLIFEQLKKFDSTDPHSRLISDMIRSEIAFYAAHTNLDVCAGGVNESLATALGFRIIYEHDTSVPICKSKENLFSLYQKIINKLQIPGCIINFDKDRPVKMIAVSGGSFDTDWTDEIAKSGADCVITGEMKYHDMLKLAGYGIAVFAAGHAVSERVVLKPLADRLAEMLPGLSIAVVDGLDYNKVVS